MEISPTLLGLIQHYSPTGHESEAVRWMIQHMRALGYTNAFEDKAGNAIGRMGNGQRQIVLLGHIDTVPGEIQIRVEGDNLYGRGSVDAKGPLAAFVEAVASLTPTPEWQLIVVGAVDEEGDSRGARALVSQYTPEFAIIGEPSHWQKVTLGYKGTAWAKIQLRKQLAHTASVQTSVCEDAFTCWGKVQSWCNEFNQDKPRLFDQITPTLREFHSGEDGFQQWAEIRLGVRLPPRLSPDDWYGHIHHLLIPSNGVAVEIERIGYPIPAYRAEKNSPLVRAMLSAIRAQGGEAAFTLKTGTADLNIVAPQWGCPAIAYGPGDSSFDHTPDEHISLVEYQKAVEVLKSALKRLTA